jgi:hypothetical protein
MNRRRFLSILGGAAAAASGGLGFKFSDPGKAVVATVGSAPLMPINMNASAPAGFSYSSARLDAAAFRMALASQRKMNEIVWSRYYDMVMEHGLT